MKLQQLSLFLENKPGRLLDACEAFGEAGVNVETMSLVEAGEYGVLRALVKNPNEAFDALKSRFSIKKTEVLAVQTPDQPGALAALLRPFASYPNVNLEYMYGFTSKKRGAAIIVLSFNNVDAALQILLESKVVLLKDDDLFI